MTSNDRDNCKVAWGCAVLLAVERGAFGLAVIILLGIPAALLAWEIISGTRRRMRGGQ